MAAAPSIDIQALIAPRLQSFFLRRYVAAFHDASLTAEQRLEARMDLESLLLALGPPSLIAIQRAFSSDELIRAAPLSAEWFVEFTSTRAMEWLQQVSLSVLERFWGILHEQRARRATVELIVKVELSLTEESPPGFGSLLVSLFRESQPDPLRDTLSIDASLIYDMLLTRIKMTPSVIDRSSGRLEIYCLQVLRYCFKDRFDELTAQDMNRIIGLAGVITEDVRPRLLSMKLFQ